MVFDRNAVRQPIDANSRTIVDSAVLKQKVYSNATYTFMCLAVPGSTLSDSVWQVTRIDSDGSVEHADSDEMFNNVATSLAVVNALTYG